MRHSEKLQGFAIAGDDKVFHWASATIDGDTVIVASPQVAKPKAVRYAWARSTTARGPFVQPRWLACSNVSLRFVVARQPTHLRSRLHPLRHRQLRGIFCVTRIFGAVTRPRGYQIGR